MIVCVLAAWGMWLGRSSSVVRLGLFVCREWGGASLHGWLSQLRPLIIIGLSEMGLLLGPEGAHRATRVTRMMV